MPLSLAILDKDALMNNRNELFIVIATAALLAFALFTVLNTGTDCGWGGNGPSEKARQADCVSHLALIGKAFFQYSLCYDDWYPTTSRISAPKWLDAESGRSLELLREADLMCFPKLYVCPSKEGIEAAKEGQSVLGHVSYNWCDGLKGSSSALSPVACDGVDNHSVYTGWYVRGEGSVGIGNGSDSKAWSYDPMFRDYCYEKTYTDYSF